MSMRKTINSFEATGYLKRNTLEKREDKNHNPIIVGDVIVAFPDGNELKVRYYQNRYKKNTTEVSQFYTELESLMAPNVNSMEKIAASAGTTLTDEQLRALSTVVTLYGSLQENFYTKKDGTLSDTIQLRGLGGRVSRGTDLRNKFDVEIFIKEMKEKEDGTLACVGLLPEYDGSVSQVDFVVLNQKVADYFLNHYHTNDTVRVIGEIQNRVEKVLIRQGRELIDGREDDVYSTQFYTNYVITNGEMDSKSPEMETALHLDDIRDALVKREEKMGRATAPKPQAAQPAFNGFSFAGSDPFGAPAAGPSTAKSSTDLCF